jgi:hypothetical protein
MALTGKMELLVYVKKTNDGIRQLVYKNHVKMFVKKVREASRSHQEVVKRTEKQKSDCNWM